jgi:hypothetical protein
MISYTRSNELFGAAKCALVYFGGVRRRDYGDNHDDRVSIMYADEEYRGRTMADLLVSRLGGCARPPSI